MGLIKSSNAPASIAPFSMKDIENHAKTLLLRARQQADQLLAAAQTEGEQLKAAAKAEGMVEGKREGLAQGLEMGKKSGEEKALAESSAQLRQAIEMLSTAAGTLSTSRADLEADALREVVKLAVSIARRVTKRQGLIDEGVLAANLEEAMRLVVDAANVRIAIHPSQRQTLDSALPKLQLSLPALKHVEIIEEQSLSPGGCRVYTLHGQVDAELDVQLDRVVADLLPSAPAEVA